MEEEKEIRKIYSIVGRFLIICSDFELNEFTENFKTADSIPKALIEKADSSYKDMPLKDLIKSLNKICKMNIKLTREKLNVRNITIDYGEIPLYMIFHHIACKIKIGWGIKGDVVYFGRNLNNMN